jgi:intracellular septation protein
MSGLVYALRRLGEDMISSLAFALVLVVTHNLALAIGVSIAVSVIQVVIEVRRGEPIYLMQWLSLGLVVILGGAALWLNDPRIAMAKVSVIYAVVGLTMLKPGWMVRYMAPHTLARGERTAVVFGYLWAGLMFATAALNLGFAWLAPVAVWTGFMAVFPIVSKLALFGVQYLAVRGAVRRARTPAECA